MIKLFQPYISEYARENVQRVLSGSQIAQGPEVELFEVEFARKFGFQPWQIVSLNSGTAALELAYELTDLRDYDHVVTPVLTCTATNIPLVRRGVGISFGDIAGAKSLNMDIDDVQDKLLPNTKAIVYVHFGGSSYGLEAFEELAEAEGIDLICDAAQALGSKLSHRARFSCISLQAIKSLTAGDGGVLVCRDEEDVEKARKLRWFGYDRPLKQRLGDCDLELAGYKMHMNDINAAIARGNLKVWDDILAHRVAITQVYSQAWIDRGYPDNLHNGIWNPSVIGRDYRAFKPVAEAAGFEVGQYHYRNDKYSIFRGAFNNCPNMDTFQDAYFMLPCHMGMTIEDAEMIATTLWGN